MRVTVRDPFQDIDGTVVGSDLTAQANPQNTLLPLIPLGSRYPEKSKPKNKWQEMRGKGFLFL